MTHSIRTVLWFDGGGLEAAQFYVSLLPGSRIEDTYTPDPAKPPLTIDFTLGGVPYQILDAGPYFKLTEAVSISVTVPDQAEVDRLWTALLAGGGQESQCGWLKDRWGLSWQIVPEALLRLLTQPDRAAADRTYQAMMQMVKLDVAALEAASAGTVAA